MEETKSSKVKNTVTRKKAPASSALGNSTTTSKTSKGGKSWGIGNAWKKHAPSYLTKSPTKKLMMDFAIFAGSAFVIYKWGGAMNQAL